MPRGIFITFEGLDGSGKTTQLGRLAARLERQGRNVVKLRQPGGTPLGSRIRSLLVDSKAEHETGPVSPMAELALMFADRAQAIAEVIEPELTAGKIVLCDRYTDSSEAYQGAGRMLGIGPVQELHRVLCGGLQPELTLLLLPPLAASLRRARRRNDRHLRQTGADENRFESEGDAFYQRVYEGYQAIAAREPERVVTIDADAGLDAIEALVWAAVHPRFPTVVQQS